ncbi:MAG TPA: hypothetical protein VJH68_01855 [Candidatus Nanoarchaeia archaeon]|nr:hypothetical protein [Candidatus Nanoarchaeia archaeon]
MEVKDIKPNQGNIDLILEVVDKEEPREFEKFGKKGKVCNAKVKDGSGAIKLTLWNEDIDKINVGDKIHLQNGWCSEFREEKQLSTGKFGKIEVVKSASMEVFSNDPEVFGAGSKPQPDSAGAEDSMEDDSDSVTMDNLEEEFVG